MTTKESRHRLVDQIPEGELDAAERFLERLRGRGRGPLPRVLLEAEADDEPEAEEEIAAVQEAYEELARGEVISNEELRREIGW